MAGAFALHSPHLISFLACCIDSFRFLKISIRRLTEKFTGIFVTSSGNFARHSGQPFSLPDLLLPSIVNLRHSSQNVCKHEIVLGSVKISLQTQHVTSCSISSHSLFSVSQLATSLYAIPVVSCSLILHALSLQPLQPLLCRARAVG